MLICISLYSWARITYDTNPLAPHRNGRAVYYTERLWQLARELPVQTVLIADIPEFEQNCWFRPHSPPTCRAVAEHAKRIAQADLSYPLFSAESPG